MGLPTDYLYLTRVIYTVLSTKWRTSSESSAHHDRIQLATYRQLQPATASQLLIDE